jgi:hypothetical protein
MNKPRVLSVTLSIVLLFTLAVGVSQAQEAAQPQAAAGSVSTALGASFTVIVQGVDVLVDSDNLLALC